MPHNAAKIAWIALGGGAGSLLRYFVAGWGQRLLGESFPLGTMIVNIAGCLAIGCLAAVFDKPIVMREEYRLALMVGLLGGFTTFSTFALETFALGNDRQYWWAAANMVLSVLAGLAAVWFGYRLVERLLGL